MSKLIIGQKTIKKDNDFRAFGPNAHDDGPWAGRVELETAVPPSAERKLAKLLCMHMG